MSEHPTVHPIPPPAFDSPFGSEISDAPGAMATVEELQHRLQELAAENARLAAAAQPNPHPPAQPATQVFGKPPKIPEPTTFNGNSNDIDRFVDQVKFWTDPCLSDQHRIRLTATRLVSHAAAWHLQYGSDHQVYSEYLEALAIYFQDPRRHERAVRQLLELKQGKSVADYNRSFTSIGLRFAADRKWPEQVLIDIYLNGLSSTVRAHVEASQRPTTLEAAQRAAIVAAGEQPSSSSRPAGQQQHQPQRHQQRHQPQRHQQRDGPTPMEIGAVQQRSNGIKQQRPQQKASRPWPPPHRPETPCPVCKAEGKAGLHWAVECPVALKAAAN